MTAPLPTPSLPDLRITRDTLHALVQQAEASGDLSTAANLALAWGAVRIRTREREAEDEEQANRRAWVHEQRRRLGR